MIWPAAKRIALSSRSSDKRARKAACGRIVGPADVSRVSGKSRNESLNRGEVKTWQQL